MPLFKCFSQFSYLMDLFICLCDHGFRRYVINLDKDSFQTSMDVIYKQTLILFSNIFNDIKIQHLLNDEYWYNYFVFT